MSKLVFTVFFISISIASYGQTVKERIKNSLSFTLDSRIDYVYQEMQIENSQDSQSQQFQFSDLLIQTSFSFTENLSLQFRYAPYPSDINSNGISDNIQYANISYTNSKKNWKFTLGKFFLNIGTAEQYYDPNDVYIYSAVGNNLGVYKTGFTVEYDTKNGQSFGAQIVNSNRVDQDDIQKEMEYNFYYFGSLADGKIIPLASFTTIPSTKIDPGYAMSVNLGVQWIFSKWHLDTDYAMAYNMPNFHQGLYYHSVPIRVLWNGDSFKPFVKYIYNHIESDSDFTTINIDSSAIQLSSEDYQTIEVGLQYYPIEHKNIRLHLVGNYSIDKPSILNSPSYPNPNSKSHLDSDLQIFLGLRIGLDFLKGLNTI